jgi:hypothetical protein
MGEKIVQNWMETMRPHCQTPEATAKSSEANWAFSQTFSLAQWQN